MSEYCPPGVRYFSYGTKKNAGKAQPDNVSKGLITVEAISGSHPAISMAKGGSGKVAGVTQHSGKEAHVKVMHKNASHGGPAKKAGASARPEGVRVFKDDVV